MLPVLASPLVQQAHTTLNPASPQARLVDRLGAAMFVTASVVFLLVIAALLWAAFRRRAPDTPLVTNVQRERPMRTAVLLATGVTTAILFGFLIFDVSVGRTITTNPGKEALQIRVTGHQWWWEVQYRDSLPQNWVTTANEIHIPVGRPVVFELVSTDVIHSFWPPNLSPKRDQIPGDENSLWFQADSAGVYRGMCAEFCGHEHAKMGFLVVAEPPGQFAVWLAAQRDTALAPTDALARRGKDVFLASTCVMCHAISGTPAGSRVGPDLTHLASRQTIAAGTLPNTRANLTGWIVDPQVIKPGVKMPPSQLSGPDLVALVAYLETLK
ncbi:MAG TPA: cytochrome c oxidase subunit II [Gemmatimonadales bacterium]|jgi:cytochrome c oxidase subunit 2|nr:cytochrome c oxidase subunit II [Gemmatimonadales bacterium]